MSNTAVLSVADRAFTHVLAAASLTVVIVLTMLLSLVLFAFPPSAIEPACIVATQAIDTAKSEWQSVAVRQRGAT